MDKASGYLAAALVGSLSGLTALTLFTAGNHEMSFLFAIPTVVVGAWSAVAAGRGLKHVFGNIG